MLVHAKIARSPAVDRLINLWTRRYTPKLHLLTSAADPWVLGELIESSLPEGRATAVTKLHELLDSVNDRPSMTQAKLLHGYLPNVLDLGEAQQLTQLVFQIYMRLLAFYQQSAAIETSPMDKLWAVTNDDPSALWGMTNIEALAEALAPMLQDLQKRYVAAPDWRTLGFMTTPLNLTNKLLLQQLTSVEQVLIHPYFQFIEEQAALPWQRVCGAAATHSLDSPALTLVSQMMPIAPDIAWTVYCRLLRQFPNHRSRTGRLEHPEVAHACLRDLEMFQAYLWLCVLQNDLQPIKQELITLCIMVMESVEVRWELIALWNKMLMDEISNRMTPEQRTFLLPYLMEIQKAFQSKRSRLGLPLSP